MNNTAKGILLFVAGATIGSLVTYKIVKNKIDAANIMISTLSKIISLRMSDMKLSGISSNGKQLLNE